MESFLTENLKIFAEAGIIGVCLALIGALVYLIKAFLKVVGNHINHSTEAQTKNTEVLNDLKDLIRNKL